MSLSKPTLLKVSRTCGGKVSRLEPEPLRATGKAISSGNRTSKGT